ncbi:MAG TPA: DUF3570 domain-containing protein [Candidatus Limnocylindrales bacterium]|nr:DUF3570 domain-containing protein [Candidatus Limnocylindrales bacterium]
MKGGATKRLGGLGLAITLYLVRLNRVSAADHVDYRFENYQEDNGRIGVDTHTWLFEKKITSWLTLRGDAVYDAIAGATPIGAPPASEIKTLNPPTPPPTPLETTVPTAHMQDTRWAGSLSGELTFGPHHITPQFSYSTEHDYTSYGTALNYSLDLNQKNTTLNLGWAHDWDTVISGTYLTQEQPKDTDHILIGINQLLSPKTVLTANFTFRNSHGYLNDPYRGVLFQDYPQFDLNKPILFPEKRPNFRQSYLGFVSLTQFITPLHGSIEGAYRYSYDTYDISAHTINLSWHQKIINRVLLSPFFRYYRQTAASFYGTQFPGDPSNPFDPTPIPTYYSADYRLSKMETFSVGVDLSAKITEWFSVNASYMRYAMYGLDNVTSSSAYPKANVVTIGASIWF